MLEFPFQIKTPSTNLILIKFKSRLIMTITKKQKKVTKLYFPLICFHQLLNTFPTRPFTIPACNECSIPSQLKQKFTKKKNLHYSQFKKHYKIMHIFMIRSFFSITLCTHKKKSTEKNSYSIKWYSQVMNK